MNDVFLDNYNIPEELKNKCLNKELSISDIIENLDILQDIPIEEFVNDENIREFSKKLGIGGLQYIIKNHRDVFKHIFSNNDFQEVGQYIPEGNDFEEKISVAIREYIFRSRPLLMRYLLEGIIPEWLSSLNFKVIDRIETMEELKKYNSKIILRNLGQRIALETFDIEKLIQFDNSTHFFFHDIKNIECLGLAILNRGYYIKKPLENKMTYFEFEELIAQCLDIMREDRIYQTCGTDNYDFITGEFREKYPQIFMDQNAPETLRNAYYNNEITGEFLLHHKEYIPFLMDKDLDCIYSPFHILYDGKFKSFIKIYAEIYGKENLLELITTYGNLVTNVFWDDKLDFSLDKNEFDKRLRQIIYERILNGTEDYSHLLEVNDFVSEYPDVFLDSNAPEELQNLFYHKSKDGLTFDIISKNPDWLKFFKGKSLELALICNKKKSYSLNKKYFELFGKEKGLKLGMQKPETVEYMIGYGYDHIKTMKHWYDKTGQKFIPDIVIMENFAIEEADKFLASAKNWHTLMKIKSFYEQYESRDAMLKLAYCFGAFDQDQICMKKLQELLTGIPRQYKKSDIAKLKLVEQEILEYNKIISLHENGDRVLTMPRGSLEYGYLMEKLKNSGIHEFNDLFNIKQDGATLKINPQNHPKAMKYLRKILEDQGIVINGSEAHQLFGGFSLKYDKDFREFLLTNFDEIRSNPQYASKVQRQFDIIRTFNSNRKLTWDLAVSFVQSSKYENVNVGNDKLSVISAIAGYSQHDFDILQQIYNYGKTRTFNSIPRIEKKLEKYSYEMLRLDDPLALAIGTLTDCCQELGNVAESCMEHSMVDKNGRIFVIKDNQGNIVAQSWVWRNKNVLCFDNIEIPDKAFTRYEKQNPDLERRNFTDEVYEIYKKAARELIEKDEIVYKELLESGKITKEQYDGLRLGKITVGLGYNDIAESLINNSTLDFGTVVTPLPFKEPVKLTYDLYTRDSRTQYILEKRKNCKEYDGETLSLYSDEIIEYTDDTFDEKSLLMLEKLELVTKNNLECINTYLDNKENIVSSLGQNYGLNPKTTRIVMNPNFALIYDVNGKTIKIGDLLYNFSIDNGEQKMDITEDVLLQIKLALDKITNGKEIDISKLSDEQLEIYKKISTLNEEIDIRKGVLHGK